jgi:ribonuclease P protein component
LSPSKDSFSKDNRFRRKREFLELRKSSRKFSGRHWFAFYAVKNNEAARLGLSVSTKYGGAVARNQFKRWTREWFRKAKKNISGVQLHIIAKGKCPTGEKASKMLYKQQFNEDLDRLSQFLAKSG